MMIWNLSFRMNVHVFIHGEGGWRDDTSWDIDTSSRIRPRCDNDDGICSKTID